jgi:subtilisin family serine protease
MPLKAFRSDGSVNLSDVIRAIYYAVDHNAKVINMSFSMTSSDPALMEAIAYAFSHQVICIASAGNEGKELRVYPAGFHGVYGVGSTNKQDRRSMFSNHGDAVRLEAPGEALVTNLVPNVQPGYLSDVFQHGKHIGQGEGIARLDLLPEMQYCTRQPSGTKTDD